MMMTVVMLVLIMFSGLMKTINIMVCLIICFIHILHIHLFGYKQ
jgi:hypothetical protein